MSDAARALAAVALFVAGWMMGVVSHKLWTVAAMVNQRASVTRADERLVAITIFGVEIRSDRP